MGDWFDDLFSGIGSTVGSSSFNNLVNLGSTAFDIYSGYNSMSQANDMYDMLFANAEKQDEWATKQMGRMEKTYWPLEDMQIGYTKEDMAALRPTDIAKRDYNIQRVGEQIAQAKQINPMLDQTEMNMLNTLTEGKDALTQRLQNEALGNVSQQFGKTREADLRRMMTSGLNPNSGAMLDYNRQSGNAEALASANALTSAATTAEDTALNRQAQALNYRAGIPMSTYNFTPSVSAGSVGSGLSSVGTTTGNVATSLNNQAQQSFTGAATSLNNMYWQPQVTQLMSRYGLTGKP